MAVIPLGRRPVHTPRQWTAFVITLAVAAVGIPLLNAAVPEDSAFHVPNYLCRCSGSILCYAMVALAMDLIWGFTGILSLGHGVFFASRRLRDGDVPDARHRPGRRLRQPSAGLHGLPRLEGAALVLVGVRVLRLAAAMAPWWCRAYSPSCSDGSRSARASTGVYFSIITQALTFAASAALLPQRDRDSAATTG